MEKVTVTFFENGNIEIDAFVRSDAGLDGKRVFLTAVPQKRVLIVKETIDDKVVDVEKIVDEPLSHTQCREVLASELSSSHEKLMEYANLMASSDNPWLAYLQSNHKELHDQYLIDEQQFVVVK